MANIGALVGGAYRGAFDAIDIGMTDDGFDLIHSLREEVVEGSDYYGDSMIDYFYRGGNVQVRCDSKEFKAGAITPYWPFGAPATMGQMRSVAFPIGRRASDIAKPLLLTAELNTPARDTPTGKPISTLTGTFAILAPGQQSTLKFTSKLRKVPIYLQLLPYDASAVTIWYSIT